MTPTTQYQILKTYKSLKSAFRNWKRNRGEKVGEIEEYHDFIIELQEDADKDLRGNKLIVLYSYNGKGFTDFYPFKSNSIHPTKLSRSIWELKNNIDLGKVD